MLSKLSALLFPSESAEIPLTCQRTLAVRRLEKHLLSTTGYLLTANTSGGIAGKVTPQHVRLHRLHESVNGRTKANAWQPWLRASFEYINGQLHLRGRFVIHPAVQLFSGVWLAGALYFTLYALWILVTGPPPGAEPIPLHFPLIGLAIFIGGLMMVRVAWHWSEDDIDHIKRFIDEHVGHDADYGEDTDNPG